MIKITGKDPKMDGRWIAEIRQEDVQGYDITGTYSGAGLDWRDLNERVGDDFAAELEGALRLYLRNAAEERAGTR